MLALVSAAWELGTPGVLRLPSGRRVRGRGLRRPLPGGPEPGFALYLLGRQPPPVPWESRWVRWPDFGLPADPARRTVAAAGETAVLTGEIRGEPLEALKT
jgi:hypothetical protein